jgi:DNA-binding NarL/FixJ family response regulator
LVRDGLSQLVQTVPEWTVAGTAASGREALTFLKTNTPDLMLIDLSMPDMSGASVIMTARTLMPSLRILAVTQHCASSFVYSALRAGANGYLVKNEEAANILRAIDCVLKGLSYISPEVAEEVIRGYTLSATPFSSGDLTPREEEIVQLIVGGMTSNKELAGQIFVSEKTVQKHKTNAFRKLNVTDCHELIQKYMGRKS